MDTAPLSGMPGTAWISEAEKVVSFTRRPGYDPMAFSSYDQMLQYVVSLGWKGYGII